MTWGGVGVGAGWRNKDYHSIVGNKDIYQYIYHNSVSSCDALVFTKLKVSFSCVHIIVDSCAQHIVSKFTYNSFNTQ